MNFEQNIMIRSVLDAWHLQIKRATNLFDWLPEEQLQNQISPGRNRGVYLLGHLTAVHDQMLPLLQFGDGLYPSLEETFMLKPDRSVAEIPAIGDLKRYWNHVNDTLGENFALLEESGWLQKHNAVTDADFEREPHRNRLSVLINRTNHLSYHLGQLTLLKK